jgi:hypothetical protein
MFERYPERAHRAAAGEGYFAPSLDRARNAADRLEQWAGGPSASTDLREVSEQMQQMQVAAGPAPEAARGQTKKPAERVSLEERRASALCIQGRTIGKARDRNRGYARKGRSSKMVIPREGSPTSPGAQPLGESLVPPGRFGRARVLTRADGGQLVGVGVHAKRKDIEGLLTALEDSADTALARRFDQGFSLVRSQRPSARATACVPGCIGSTRL